jgi:hypothetical protein
MIFSSNSYFTIWKGMNLRFSDPVVLIILSQVMFKLETPRVRPDVNAANTTRTMATARRPK